VFGDASRVPMERRLRRPRRTVGAHRAAPIYAPRPEL